MTQEEVVTEAVALIVEEQLASQTVAYLHQAQECLRRLVQVNGMRKKTFDQTKLKMALVHLYGISVQVLSSFNEMDGGDPELWKELEGTRDDLISAYEELKEAVDEL